MDFTEHSLITHTHTHTFHKMKILSVTSALRMLLSVHLIRAIYQCLALSLSVHFISSPEKDNVTIREILHFNRYAHKCVPRYDYMHLNTCSKLVQTCPNLFYSGELVDSLCRDNVGM